MQPYLNKASLRRFFAVAHNTARWRRAALHVCAALLLAATTAFAGDIAQSNVAWTTPSKNSLGSMPLGNGDIAANVWVEPTGDLVLLLSKTDAYDEFNRLLKLGRIRIKTTPSLAGQPFIQTLRLENGSIEINSGATTARVWIDANHPVVQVDLQSDQPMRVEVKTEIWRTQPRELNRVAGKEKEIHSANYNRPEKNRVNPDTILPHRADQTAWCHHNIESQWAANLELTGMGAEIARGTDPILKRTFGAVVRGTGLQAVSDTEMKSAKPGKSVTVQIFPLTKSADSPAVWLKAAEQQADGIATSTEERWAAHQDWWRAYWDRSWILVGGGALILPSNAHPWRVGADSDGGSRFGGTISQARVIGRALSAEEIAGIAGQAPRLPSSSQTAGEAAILQAEVITDSCTVAAWIRPSARETGRILDKCTVGKPDGFIFDTHPGRALRWIVGPHTMILPACLQADEWQHVAATVDAATGARRIYLSGKLLKEERGDPDADRVTRAYAHQRFVTACAGRGALPIRFNGSLFTVDQVFDPDYRRWGGAYWWQNTRLPYWSMLYSGDYDQMLPLFRMYRDALPLRKAATRKYYSHDGAFYPETMYFWGNYTDMNYGLDRKGKPDGLTDNTYIRRYWQGGLELVGMMLDYHDGTRDAAFRDETLLPLAKEITTFFDQHWKRGEDGKIFYSPAQSLETWHSATNPTPEIVGLRYLLPRLLELPVDETTRAQWRKLLADQPGIPTQTNDGQTRVLPATTFNELRNVENPELYAVFPYRAFNKLAGPDALQIGINTWNNRRNRANVGWQQQPIQAALLGLTNEAKVLTVQRTRGTAAGYRFPGFYGPNYDWTPDQDQISVFMVGLQYMLMQCEGDKILLLPAWPKEWDVSFKLHAPYNTTVEGVYRAGKLEQLKVTPDSRRKDVIFQVMKPSAHFLWDRQPHQEDACGQITARSVLYGLGRCRGQSYLGQCSDPQS